MAARAFQTPRKDIVRADQMASVRIFEEGVGIFNDRKRMIGWIEVEDGTHAQHVSDILFGIIENPRNFAKPDWSFLSEVTETSTTVTAAALAPQPKRNNGNNGNNGNNAS